MKTLGAFAYRSFVLIWTANLIALIGIAAFDAAAAWLMTSLNPDPFMVSLVLTATVLPMFLLTLIGGVISDVFDPRRILIVNLLVIVLMVASFATILSAKLVTSTALLATVFVLSGAWAVNAPAWLALYPSLVPKEDLGSAIAASGLAQHLSRLVGPGAFTLAIALLGGSGPFWFFCSVNLAAVILILARSPPEPAGAKLRPERIFGAMRVGVRHAAHNRRLRTTLARTASFFLFASASTALLPLVARHAAGRPELYSAMLSATALGAVVGSLTFVALRERFGLDRAVSLSVVLLSAAMAAFGASRSVVVLIAACLVAGFAVLIAMTSLYVSAQQVLPDWVRARGLAILLTVGFGATSLGSAAWGKFASAGDPSNALLVAAAGALLLLPLTSRLRLEAEGAGDLEPSRHWRKISFARTIGDDEGPVLVTVDYRVGPAERPTFLKAVEDLGDERLRNGATRWGVFEDVEDAGRYVEIFSLDSWLDLNRMRERVTKSDHEVEQAVDATLRGLKVVRFHVAPRGRPRLQILEAEAVQAMMDTLTRKVRS